MSILPGVRCADCWQPAETRQRSYTGPDLCGDCQDRMWAEWDRIYPKGFKMPLSYELDDLKHGEGETVNGTSVDVFSTSGRVASQGMGQGGPA